MDLWHANLSSIWIDMIGWMDGWMDCILFFFFFFSVEERKGCNVQEIMSPVPSLMLGFSYILKY